MPRIAWNKGRKGIYSLEYRKKISDTLKKKNIRPPSRKGKRMSKSWRRNHSKRLKRAGVGLWMRGRLCNFSEMGKKGGPASRKAQSKKHGLTNIEKIINDYLHKRKIKHIHEKRFGCKIVDFFLPEFNLILEADSDYWHKGRDEKSRDLYIKKIDKTVSIVHLKEGKIKDGSWIKLLRLENP